MINQVIRDMHRDGRITAQEAVMLMELRAELERRRRRKLFWYWFRDGFSLGPLRRWVMRKLKRTST